AVVDGADNRQLVGVPGHVRHQLGNLDAVHVLGDRLERPADIVGCRRFHVPEIDVAWRTTVEDQDDRFRLALAAEQAARRRAEPVCPEETETRGGAGCQELAPRRLSRRMQKSAWKS